MKRVLILGTTGFIGRNCVERFAANPEYEVMAALRQGDMIDAHRWCGDLRDAASVNSLISGWHPDIIIHAAATTSGSKDIVNTPAIHVTDNAVMGSFIFRAAHEAGVKQVIFFSCTTMWSNGHVNEESPIDIHPRYFGVAWTKIYLEKMAEFYASLGRTKFTVIRHSNVYGPHDKFDLERSHMMGATIRKVCDAVDVVKVWGNGEESRDLLYIDDLVDFVELAIKKEANGLYNCGYGIAFKVKDIVQRVIEASGKDLQIEYDLSAPTIPTSLSLDCTKAQNELGWNPKVTLPEGIKKTMEWRNEFLRG